MPAAVAGTTPGAVRVQGTLAQRIPWFWHEYVVARTPLPLWALSIVFFGVLCGIVALSGLAAGELSSVIRDPTLWLTGAVPPATTSFAIGYAPRAMDRLWTSIQPWMTTSAEQMALFRAEMPKLLARFAWLGMLVLALATSPWVFVDQETGGFSFANLTMTPNVLMLALLPFWFYFVGIALAIATVGMGLLAHRMSRTLHFRREFILSGARTAFRPFNRLLWVIWLTVTFPLIASSVVTNPLLSDRSFHPIDALSFLSGLLIILPTIVVPQLFMNRLLAREKANEVQVLRQEVEEASDGPEAEDTIGVLRRIQRHQYLVYWLQRTESFSPTLVDTRFVLQIATSITGIVLANVILRAVLA